MPEPMRMRLIKKMENPPDEIRMLFPRPEHADGLNMDTK